ncbi:MAG: phytoene/squalene synthase family protein [Hyphomonadaceae bacterium]|nr:phytoene/squalene synthase family protein [Hyphomonadaceae bacterium]
MQPTLLVPERATPADLAACRQMIRTGSRSFYLASMLLPDRIRSGAYALYGFCRLSDDLVDVDGRGLAAIAHLQMRLDKVFAGAPADLAIDRALADSVERFAIPRAPFDALLEGLAWDAQARQVETQSDLHAYAARVASAVGAMMAALMGARDPHLVARACDLGAAMQMTNIARDVGEDARAGRLYLPRDWMRAAGLDPDAWLAAPRFCPELAQVVQRLLTTADALYARADAGIAGLGGAYRPAIRAARRLYAAIGDEVARQGYDSVSRRAVTPAWRKAALALQAMAPQRGADLTAPALPETQFLVDALCAAPSPRRPGDARGAAWVLMLFATLENRPRRLA